MSLRSRTYFHQTKPRDRTYDAAPDEAAADAFPPAVAGVPINADGLNALVVFASSAQTSPFMTCSRKIGSCQVALVCPREVKNDRPAVVEEEGVTAEVGS